MLVTMKEILDKASAGNYAVAAPNLWTELDARAVIDAAEELRAPLILDIAYPPIRICFCFVRSRGISLSAQPFRRD